MSKVNKVIDFKTQQQIFYKHKGNTVVNKQEDRIEGFTGDYFSFLHNDFPSLIRFSNLLFPSISSAFQAARSQNQEEREAIASVDSPEELWNLAVKIEDPEDWEQRKLKVMESLLRDKFRRNKDLKERLMETGNRQLINTYDEETESNLYWGHVNGKGQNHLGKLLENIRNDIQRGLDLHKWIFFTFSLERDLNLVPLIKLNVFKDGKQIETLNLEKKNFFIFGTQKTNDVILAHPMISRQHACILCDNEQNIKLIDLGSKGGTYLNDELIEEYTGVDLEFDDVISFSVSTRKYYVEIDYTQVYNSLMKQERDLKRELMLLEKLDNPNISKAELREVLGFSVEDTIYVGNLPFSASISDIKDHFKQYGSVKKVKFLENSIGKSKGVALVTYKTPQQAKTALLKAVHSEMGGRKLRVSIMDKIKMAEVLEEKNEKEIEDSFQRRRADYLRSQSPYKRTNKEKEDRAYERERERERDRDRERRNRKYRSRSRSNNKKSKKSKKSKETSKKDQD